MQTKDNIQEATRRVRTIAVLSAGSPMGAPATAGHNEEATQRLLHTLTTGHAIHIPARGTYGDLPENPIFIFNVSLDYAKSLADTFGHERVAFVDITSPERITYQHWKRPTPRKQLRMVAEQRDTMDASNDADNCASIGSRLQCPVPILEGYGKTLTALSECQAQHDVDRMLTETTTSGWSGWHQYVTMARLYGDNAGEIP